MAGRGWQEGWYKRLGKKNPTTYSCATRKKGKKIYKYFTVKSTQYSGHGTGEFQRVITDVACNVEE